MRLLSHLLRRFIRNGSLTVTDHAGVSHRFSGGGEGPSVAIRLTDKAVEREIFFNPELKVAEAYMDGRLAMEGEARVFDPLMLFSVNRSGLAPIPYRRHSAESGGRCGVPSSAMRSARPRSTSATTTTSHRNSTSSGSTRR